MHPPNSLTPREPKLPGAGFPLVSLKVGTYIGRVEFIH